MADAGTRRPLDVLVIDDHPFIRVAVERMLRKLGIRRVVTAENGLDARQKLDASERPDIIFCDLSMPQEDGLSFLRWLSEHRADIPIVLVSGEENEVLQAAQRLGKSHRLDVAAVLPKPVSLERLRGVLDDVGLLQSTETSARSQLPQLSADEIAHMMVEQCFEVWYQPQIATSSRQVTGFEALLRLRHPDLGLVPPVAFIGVAEQNGLIKSLTRFVTSESIRMCGSWRQAGLDLGVAINISAYLLEELDALDHLNALCAEHDVPNHNVTLELTESALTTDGTKLLEIMTRLRMNKFKLSIDDFGTGYSSLEQLKGLPFHELKLDKGFVLDAVNDTRSRAILENSLRLALDLKLKTVAEGVETQSHLDLISELGCDVAQGFLIAKPMPAADVADWTLEYLAGLE